MSTLHLACYFVLDSWHGDVGGGEVDSTLIGDVQGGFWPDRGDVPAVSGDNWHELI